MSALGIELSDAGILVAGGDPPALLKVDGNGLMSPGFALPEKNRLTVGSAAERKAHLYPRQILNRFWDQLNTEALDQPITYAHNHAEIAFEHFAHIWQNVRQHGTEIVIAVPGFYTREHLGLILGITRELAASVRAFVPLSIAAVPDRLPKGLLLHLDLHLQRFEITRLKREGQLSREESISAEGTGLGILHRRWVDAIAEEFVRHTRFDPLHQAASEQELYDRLPGILAQLNQDPSVHFEMTGGSKVYHVTLTADLFKKTATPVLEEIRRLIVRFCDRYGQNDPDRILLVTDRLAGLPGIKKMLNGIENCKVVALPIGSGAMGSLRFQEPSGAAGTAGGAPFLTTRSLPVEATIPIETHRQEDAGPQRPTHILYRNLAYPIAKRPLIIGIAPEQGATAIQIRGQVAGVSRKHCSIQQRGDDVILEDHSTYGTYVNEKPVTGKAKLALGQIIRVGTPGEKLKLIACLGTPIEET